MADTRLQAVATAEDRTRIASAAVRESVAAFAAAGPAGHSGYGVRAAVALLATGFASAVHCIFSDPAFAHPIPYSRPASVRAGAAARSGVPRQRRPLRTGPSRLGHARELGTSWQTMARETAGGTSGRGLMGTDRGPSAVVQH